MSTTTIQNLDQHPPRSGRDMLGGYSWLARLADKVRADHAGQQGEYIAYCGLSLGFLEQTGVTQAAFDKLITDGASDADLVAYFDKHVDAAHRDAANDYVLHAQKAHLDEQDMEEGRAS